MLNTVFRQSTMRMRISWWRHNSQLSFLITMYIF